jgi:phosphoserine phosphatase
MAMVPMSFSSSGEGSKEAKSHLKVIFFDMDSTVIDAEGIIELARAQGVGDYVADVTARAMNGELDFEQALNERVKLLRGLPYEKALEVADSIPLMPGAEKLMKELKSLGFRTALISGGFTIIADRVAGALAMDYVYANELVVDEGKFTGEVKGPLTKQSSKKEVLEEICTKLNINPRDCIAVGDGSNDLCWKGVVGMFIAFNAKPIVREAADVVVDQKDLGLLIPVIRRKNTDMLKELQDKKTTILKQAEEFKANRNQWNSKASSFSKRRDELNKQTKELIDKAQEYRVKRDEFNGQVSANKDLRNELNEKANEVYAKVDGLRKKDNIGSGRSLNELRKEIDHLEFKQQTEVLTTEKERALVDKISELKEEFKKKKEQLEQNGELKGFLGDAQGLRDQASEFHKKVKENADLAQEYHDKMIECFRDADKIRAEADAQHKEFVKAQETADEFHKQFLKFQKELRDFDKVIVGLKKKAKTEKESKEKVEYKKQAEDVFAQFKAGEKLNTEDLLLLQRSGFL